jgi:two-component system sensor histidine kinase ChiS
MFTHDIYVVSNKPKSILCAPVTHKGKVAGILYLENNLTANAFTPERLELLRILSSQAAISIENARLYEELAQKNIALTELNELKDEFLAQTSHELKTPLAGILGIAESLHTHLPNESTNGIKPDIELIIAASRRLLNLVNDILDFIRLKHKDITLQLGSVDLKSSVDVVFELSRPLIRGKKLSLINKIDIEPVFLHADPNRLQQILLNLVNNAIKFTASGEISVSAANIEDKGLVRISVSDTGVGIPKNKIKSIFDYSNKTAPFMTSEYEGTRIGLSVTKHLIELHGGTIWIESMPGKGSDFIFTLPAFRNEIHNDFYSLQVFLGKKFINVEDIEELYGNKGNFLVIDDESMNLGVIRAFLEGEDYSVTFLTSPEEAIDLINSGCFDLVLLDVMMPGRSGYDVCRIIREKYSIYELPVVLLTVRNNLQDIITGFNAGANDYLIKPVQKEELLARIGTLIQLKKSVKEHKNAEYKLLQEHMNPHFLFNTLHNIHSWIVRDSQRADHMLLKLAEIYRYILSHSCQPIVSFSEEWEFVKDYLEIQKYHYSSPLQTQCELFGNFNNVDIPPLTIQPLVENCIKHGFRDITRKGCIEITARRDNEEVRVDVCDNGEGLSDDISFSSLENIKKRLLHYYNVVELKLMNRAQGGVQASLYFKL